jgi:DNA repair protein RadC
VSYVVDEDVDNAVAWDLSSFPLTRRLAEGARILQINMLDHVIVGQSFDGRAVYFSFKEASMI